MNIYVSGDLGNHMLIISLRVIYKPWCVCIITQNYRVALLLPQLFIIQLLTYLVSRV